VTPSLSEPAKSLTLATADPRIAPNASIAHHATVHPGQEREEPRKQERRDVVDLGAL
jgi:hypothetical protein